MLLFRITKSKFTDGLSAEGAKLFGGRFNSIGRPMVYLATSESVALLEVRVHSPDRMPPDRRFHDIEVPDLMIATLGDLGLTLPADWRQIPAPLSTRALGDSWLASNASLALKVSSAVSPRDTNVLVNPLHPNFKSVKQLGSRVEQLDGRLW